MIFDVVGNSVSIDKAMHSTVEPILLLGNRNFSNVQFYSFVLTDLSSQCFGFTGICPPAIVRQRIEMVEYFVSVVEHQQAPVTAARAIWILVVVDGQKDRGVGGQGQGSQNY